MDNGQNNPPNQAANATANPNLQNQPTIPINGGSGDDGTNGGSNDSADEQHAPDREPEENRVVTWNGVGG
ncbi:hypothetical protein FRB91_002145 [Serendipita sp. 411]|nr:hypothetical protein FRB91_002145 [Serendipita sp. 411]